MPTHLNAAETVVLVGKRIRRLRMEQKLTLQDLADRTGLSSSMLSLVERGRTSASVGTLVAISSALGTQMVALFEEGPEESRERVHRVADQPTFQTRDGVTRRLLRTDPKRAIELSINEYEPGTGSADEVSHHRGYEYGLVLEGSVAVEVDGERHVLEPGDSIAYSSSLEHRIVNAGDGHATTLWVNLLR